MFVEFSKRCVDYIKRQSDRVDGIEAKDLGARFSLSMVLNNIFNAEEDCFGDRNDPEILNIIHTFASSSQPSFMWKLLSTLYPFLNNFGKISFAADHQINSYIAMMRRAVETREKNPIRHSDFLDYLMKLRKKKNLSIDSLSSYAIAFDGFDTTSSVISNALYEIAKNREVQIKLRDELKKSMPTEQDYTYENVVNHEYLDQVWHGKLFKFLFF